MAPMKDKDTLQRFLFDGTDTRGEITTLASSYQNMVASKNYPTSVSLLFGEFLAAASLLSSSLKYPGIVSIQASGSGPISMIMAECSHGQQLRGIVRGNFDNLTAQQQSERQGVSVLLGKSTLAITVEPENSERYQGIVPIESDNLSDCLEYYFEQSVQLPTRIRLASNETCAAGILIQQMPSSQTMIEQQHEMAASMHLISILLNLASNLNCRIMTNYIGCSMKRKFGYLTLRHYHFFAVALGIEPSKH